MHNYPITYVYGGLGAILLLIIVAIVVFVRKKNRTTDYHMRWKEIQKLLSHKNTWKEAVLDADKLLDELLKKKHFKGKTMGERLVAAQHHITANDMVWYSHKLKNKVVYESLELTKIDTKRCLLGFWRALKDLGAFKNEED